jgi:hypothetical protein
MSETLERVIQDQQAKIDSLEAKIGFLEESLAGAKANLSGVFEEENELMKTMVKIMEWKHLRSVWKDGEKEKWQEFQKMKSELKLKMADLEFCFRCNSMRCECDS